MEEFNPISPVFTEEIKELVSIAFKEQLGDIRKSLQAARILMDKIRVLDTKQEERIKLYNTYRDGLQQDLKEKGIRQIQIIEDLIEPFTVSGNTKIFCLKLKADIYRYMTENCPTAEKSEHKTHAAHLYVVANKLADHIEREAAIYAAAEAVDGGEVTNSNSIVNPMILGLRLNRAIFLHKVEARHKEALTELKKTIDSALMDFENWDKDEKKRQQISYQVQLIQENIKLLQDQGIKTESDEEN